MIVFDIETSPFDKDHVLAFNKPFEPPPHPGEFDESAVNFGNTKDPEKRKAKVEETRAKHLAAVENYDRDLRAAEDKHVAEVMEKATLDALTSRVLAIGYKSLESGQRFLRHGDDEPAMLKEFWGKYSECRTKRRKLVGHYIHDYDVPFIFRRSAICGVPVPATVLDKQKWIDTAVFYDTLKIWACGSRTTGCPCCNPKLSLNFIDRALGGAGKPPGMDGSNFHKLYNAGGSDREQALSYLRNDLDMGMRVAIAVGLT